MSDNNMDSSKQSHQLTSTKLWPPSQSTRLQLLERIINNFITPSTFSRMYGLLSKEEAEDAAKQIEEMAFTTANKHFENEPDDNRASAVQIYSKESRRLMLEVLKTDPNILTSNKATAANGIVFHISRGCSFLIEADEAEELLIPLKVHGNSYTKICFRNRSFGLGAAQIAGPVLSSIKDQLKEVELSDFVGGRSELEAIEVMNIFSSALEGCALRCLDLSKNAMGEEGIRAFGSLFRSQNHLEELYLMNDGISEKAAKEVSELIPSTDKLRVLHFHNDMIGDEGAVAISKIVKQSPHLEDFRCSSTRVGSKGGVALSEALGSCTNLKKLDLRDNMFGVEAGIALSKSISGFADLTEIFISDLKLEDEGAEAIAYALKESAPSLEVLDMAGNDITAKSAAALATCIDAKQFLTKLNLAENELKDEGATLIGKALVQGHGRLNEVDLSTNLITRAGARILAEAVKSKPGFKLLNINGNCIYEEGIDEVKNIFKYSPLTLEPLDENSLKEMLRRKLKRVLTEMKN